MKRNTQQLKDLIQVRRDILRMVHNVNSGHPGGSLGCTEFMVALYQNLMDRKEGFDMDGIEKIFSSFQTDISHRFFIAF
jgi:transketolase